MRGGGCKLARALVVNMFSGGDAKRWTLEKDDVVAVNIDLDLGLKLMEPHV